jgi:hypothetical protein
MQGISVQHAKSRLVVLALIAMTITIAVTYKTADAGSPVYFSYTECNPHATGYGVTLQGSVTTTVTNLTSSGSCTYRAVDLFWWNGSAWVSYGLVESTTANVGIGIPGTPTPAYGVHRIGWSEWFYSQVLSYA